MSENRFERPDPVDPEVRELLREIAAREEARLLRPRSPRNVRELLGEGAWVRAGATGLAAAERHLLQRHREEAAFLLREMAHEGLRAAASFRRMLCEKPQLEAARDASALALRLEREVAELSASYEFEGQNPDLQLALQLARRTRPSVSALARASLQLVPSFEARLCLGADLLQREAFGAALATYTRIRHLAPTPAQRTFALAWSGVVLGRRKDFEAAAEAQRRCAHAAPHEPIHAWNWLSYAVQTGDDQDCASAVEFVERQTMDDEVELTRWISNAVAQRQQGEWTVTPAAASSARRVARRAHDRAGRILDVFL